MMLCACRSGTSDVISGSGHAAASRPGTRCKTWDVLQRRVRISRISSRLVWVDGRRRAQRGARLQHAGRERLGHGLLLLLLRGGAGVGNLERRLLPAETFLGCQNWKDACMHGAMGVAAAAPPVRVCPVGHCRHALRPAAAVSRCPAFSTISGTLCAGYWSDIPAQCSLRQGRHQIRQCRTAMHTRCQRGLQAEGQDDGRLTHA